MNVASSSRIAFEPIRSLAFGSISGTYAGVGNPFANPVRQLIVNNNTSADMFFSFDGVDDHFFLATGTSIILDYCSNKNDMAGALEQPAGVRIYVREVSAAPTSGSAYVSVIYASQA